ncbi:MAG: hypothetical protein M5T52_08755 [Ignavibacteriaceae bacterium]|nr:hypothetical protein [Ignavibacteriaceae bacterium]
MLRITKFPSRLVAAPNSVPTIIMLAPTNGSPVCESFTEPESLPVVPA